MNRNAQKLALQYLVYLLTRPYTMDSSCHMAKYAMLGNNLKHDHVGIHFKDNFIIIRMFYRKLHTNGEGSVLS